MGSSYIRYRKTGFWVNESLFGLWIMALQNELELSPSRPRWYTKDLSEIWRIQYTLGFGGIMNLELDKYIANDQDAKSLLYHCSNLSDKISSNELKFDFLALNRSGYGGPDFSFIKEISPFQVLELGHDFMRLITENLHIS